MTYLLRRGVACSFPLFKEHKKYRTDKVFDILLRALGKSKNVQRFKIFEGATDTGFS
jgi:hypothetical protein